VTELELDATTLTDWQDCRRRALLNADWRYTRWRPKSLLDACLRQGISRLCSGATPDLPHILADARSQFMQAAANPGLDTLHPPYQVAKDHCAMISTILTGIARLTLLVTKGVPPVRLSSRLSWRTLSPADESGMLHRWITVDHWDQTRLMREMHGWRVFGDIAITGRPLTLHVIVIGQERKGRRASPWARAWKHPTMPKLKLRFKRNDGSSFNGWLPVYLADDPYGDVDAWVDQMYREEAARELIVHVPINTPSESVCAGTRAQVMLEGSHMLDAWVDRGAVPWSSWPMSRGACDGMVPCVFQYLCHAETVQDPEKVGLYQRRAGVGARSTEQDDKVRERERVMV
jgi:hypothetical protein